MSDRANLIAAFLRSVGWGEARQRPLAGDASMRRYVRLFRGSDTAILMDADPAHGEDVRPFLQIARHLRARGLAAPEIMAEDAEAGLLLLEDFGDGVFARIATLQPERETSLYLAATEVLLTLHRQPPPKDLEAATPRRLAGMIAPAFEWYAGQDALEAETIAAVETALKDHAAETDVLILRDYHAENLVWRKAGAGIGRVGLLDFQDAMQGHPAYDLVSLLQDARRDVGTKAAEAALTFYLRESGRNRDEFCSAIAILGAQRNTRILGIFARLAALRGKPHYIDLIPRVWGHLQKDLAHPALAGIARLMQDALPPPDHCHLKGLKARCRMP
ncbi:MAG: aminoglycoside phosphotransferase family protein [Paracoccaceae bacterium]